MRAAIGPREIRWALVTAAILVLAYVLWIARGALFPFVFGAVIAFIIAPLVERLAVIQPWYGRRPETARGVAVLTVYGMVLILLVLAGLLFVPILVREVNELVEEIPQFVEEAQARIESWSDRYQDEVPANVRERIDEAIASGSTELTAIIEDIGLRSLRFAFSTLSSLLGYIAVPFFVFYALKDRDRAFGRFYSYFPDVIRADVRECVRIANQTLGAYVRGQLFLALVIFTATFLGLTVLDVQFALGLAFVAGITELVPIIGPLIGFVPAFIVVLATEPEKWWWIVLFYLGLQAAENYLLVPRVHSTTVNLHPALVLILLTIGGALWGFWGVLVIVPLAAAIRDVFAYIHGRLVEAERNANANLPPAEPQPPPEPVPPEPEPAPAPEPAG